MKRPSLYHEEMMANVLSIGYDFQTHTGYLQMENYNCCDMGGAIKFFTRIDSKVNTIRTFAGKEEDTLYLYRNDKWKAYDLERVRLQQEER